MSDMGVRAELNEIERRLEEREVERKERVRLGRRKRKLVKNLRLTAAERVWGENGKMEKVRRAMEMVMEAAKRANNGSG